MAAVALALTALESSATAQSSALTISPTSLSFCAQPGQGLSTAPINVTTASGRVPFVVSSVSSDVNWLSVYPSSGTATTDPQYALFATAQQGLVNLQTGTYYGQVTLSTDRGVIATIPASLQVNVGDCGVTGSGFLSSTPGALSFQLPAGVTTADQQVNIGNTFPANVILAPTVTTNIGQGWLTVLQTVNLNVVRGYLTPFTVTVNTTGLDPHRTYTGNIELDSNIGAILNIPVTLNMNVTPGSLTPSASPSQLNINIPFGTPAITQLIQITNPTDAPVNISTEPSFTTGLYWLAVSPTAELIPPKSIVPLTATITTSGLALGANHGNIRLDVMSGGGGSLNIPLAVNYGTSAGNSSLSIAPAQLAFAYQSGTAAPPAQNLTLASKVATSFSVQTNTGGAGWLTVTPSGGSTNSGGIPASVAVRVNPNTLPQGTYQGQIIVTNTNTGQQQAVSVSLLVSSAPILATSASSATFSYQAGSSTFPTQQVLSLASSAKPLSYAASVAPGTDPKFLIATPASGVTPQGVTLAVDPAVVAQLPPNSYSAVVNVAAAGAGNATLYYPVTLNVTNDTMLNPSQTSLNFSYQAGQSQPPAQIVRIGSSAFSLNYTIGTSSSSCGNFFSVTSSLDTTPGTLVVTVNPAGLPPGVCSGSINVISATAGNSPLSIPVSLTVGNSPMLGANPAAIYVIAQLGTNAPAQTLSLTSTDGTTPLNFAIAAATSVGKDWLQAGPTGGATPNALGISFKTASLPAGTYTGSIVISSTGTANAPLTVPVTVVITPLVTASASPSSASLAAPRLSLEAASQPVQIASTVPGLNFAASAVTFGGGNWLSVSPSSGATPANVLVSANAGSLAQGTYSGLVTITIGSASNGPLTIPVTLTVGPAQSLAINTAVLSFNYTAGSGSLPAAQTLQLGGTGGNVPFSVLTAGLNGAVNFLTATPSLGATPAQVSVGLNASVIASLPAGQYSGNVTISSANVPGGDLAVTVTLVISPSLGSLVNGASLKAGAVSPGEMITIYGAGLGPMDGVLYSPTPQNSVPTTLAGTSVSFDGIPAPLIFAGANQINAIVPYEIAGRPATSITISRNGAASAALTMAVAETAPAIFSANQTGDGPGAILNADNSPNSAANPAEKGAVVQIFATGEGICAGVATGSLISALPPFPKPAANVAVTIGGVPAEIQYAGEAPGLAAGMLQVNAVVPQKIGAGAQLVVLTIGNNTNSSQSVTVAVQ